MDDIYDNEQQKPDLYYKSIMSQLQYENGILYGYMKLRSIVGQRTSYQCFISRWNSEKYDR